MMSLSSITVNAGILHDGKQQRKKDTGKSGQSQSVSCQRLSPRRAPCINADRAWGQVQVVSSIWIKLLLKWEGDSVLKQLSHTLGDLVGFCAKACKYKSHAWELQSWLHWPSFISTTISPANPRSHEGNLPSPHIGITSENTWETTKNTGHGHF